MAVATASPKQDCQPLMRPCPPHLRVVVPMILMAVAGGAAAQTPSTRGAGRRASADPDSIVARAVARRREMLAGFSSVTYDAYVELSARDLGRHADSSQAVVFISQDRSSVYWAPDGRYQETVLARRETRGIRAPPTLVAVNDILDVDRSRIDLTPYASVSRVDRARGGGFRHAHRAAPGFVVPSPLARSAFRHYAYRLLDTVRLGDRRVFRLAVIPRSDSRPLFIGTIEIADSTYDSVAMDLGVNDAVHFTSVRRLRYEELFHDIGDGRWMPYRIRLTGQVRPGIMVPFLPRSVAGVAVPGLPRRLGFEEVARLGEFAFDSGSVPRGVGQYRIVVDKNADRPDSAAWAMPPAVPLDPAEKAAWARADSSARHPPTLVRVGEHVGSVMRVVSNWGSFHYDRVDGYYLGASHDWHLVPGGRAVLDTRVGSSVEHAAWQYRLGARARVSDEQHLWVGAWYHDQTLAHPTLISSQYNPTVRALFAGADPLDYYRERGFGLSASMRLWDLTRLDLSYDDARQSTLDTLPGLRLFRSRRYPRRGNPPIADGHLRALSATFSYDSREYLRSHGEDFRLPAPSWTRIAIGAEVAAPSVLPDAFSYDRYTLQIERAQPLLGMGTATVSFIGGIATGPVPPQRYFIVDYGMEFLPLEGSGFTTLHRIDYYGTRAAVVTVRQDFGKLPFVQSGLPLIDRLPFTLSIDGGVFWTDFADHASFPGDTALAAAPRPYTEVGFALGNLTPFLSPLNLSVQLAWQLSHYPTRKFRFEVGLTEP